MRIEVAPFRGMIPRTESKYLDAPYAQKAVDVDVRSGELRPLRDSDQVHFFESDGLTLNVGTIFRWGYAPDKDERSGEDYDGPTRFWLRFAGDVDVVNGPVADDAWQRIYWTGDKDYAEQSGHDGPRMSYTPAIYAGQIGGDERYPAQSFGMGIPRPEGAIDAQAEPPQQVTVSEIFRERPMRVKTEGNHGFRNGQLVLF